MSKNETPDVALPFSDVWRQMEFEIERLRKENKQLRDAYDTEALLISYNLGYTCAKDMATDEITRLRADNEKLREVFKPFLTKYKWLFLDESSDPTFYADDGITLAQLWAARAAIRESGND